MNTTWRGGAFFALWVVLIGSPSDLIAGVLVSGAATWTSIALLPAGLQRVRLSGVLPLIPHFIWKSVVAGWDVARRALDPRMPLHTGFVAYPAQFRGLARNAFASYSSLLPGTLPVEDDGEILTYHCLDIRQPVVADLAAEETALAQVLSGYNSDHTDHIAGGSRR